MGGPLVIADGGHVVWVEHPHGKETRSGSFPERSLCQTPLLVRPPSLGARGNPDSRGAPARRVGGHCPRRSVAAQMSEALSPRSSASPPQPWENFLESASNRRASRALANAHGHATPDQPTPG